MGLVDGVLDGFGSAEVDLVGGEEALPLGVLAGERGGVAVDLGDELSGLFCAPAGPSSSGPDTSADAGDGLSVGLGGIELGERPSAYLGE